VTIVDIAKLSPATVDALYAVLHRKAPLEACTESIEIRTEPGGYTSIRVTPEQLEAVSNLLGGPGQLLPGAEWGERPESKPAGEKRGAKQRRLARKRMLYMIGRYGPAPEGGACATCKYLVHGGTSSRRSYLKCQIYGKSSSESTDWRKKWEGCGAYNRESL
jgi:hypothetical protein